MLKVVELYNVEKSSGILAGMAGDDAQRLTAGARICCGARVWTVTRIEQAARPGVVGAWLNGDHVVMRGMEFRLVGDPMGKEEFSRSATALIKLAAALRSVDCEAFVVACGPDLEPLAIAARAIKAAQDLFPSAHVMRPFEDGVR